MNPIPGRRRWWTCDACGATAETVDGTEATAAVHCGSEMRLSTIEAMCGCGQPGGHPDWCPPEYYARFR